MGERTSHFFFFLNKFFCHDKVRRKRREGKRDKEIEIIKKKNLSASKSILTSNVH